MAEMIPFDERGGSLWLDGKIVPWGEAKIHVLTHGLHFASSVFEGERIYSGRIFKLEEHTKRLFKSAELYYMPLPYALEDLRSATHELIGRNGLKS